MRSRSDKEEASLLKQFSVSLAFRHFRGFFFGSVTGVAVDLVLFQMLHTLGVHPFVSNVVSSFAAICVTYALVTRYAFEMTGAPLAFVSFVAWYAISIAVFSELIAQAVLATGSAPILWKLASLPFSFSVNFLFTRLLFTKLLVANRARTRKEWRWWAFSTSSHRRDRFLLVAAIIATMTVGILLAFRTELTSDSLFLEDLSHDLFVNGGLWSDWRLTAAPAFVPDMLLYFLAYAFPGNAVSRTIFVSLTQWALLGVSVVWLAKVLLPRIRLTSLSVVVVAYGVFTLVTAVSDVWVFFYSTNNHFAAFWLPIVAISITLPYLERKGRRWRLAVLAAVVFAGELSTAVFLLAFVVPSVVFGLGAICVLRGSAWSTTRIRIFSTISAIAIGAIAATGMSRLLILNDPSSGRIAFSIEGMVASVRQVLVATRYALASGNELLTLFSLTIIVAALYVMWKFVRSVRFERLSALPDRDLNSPQWTMTAHWSESRLVVISFLAVCSLLTLFAGSVVSSGFQDQYGYRYLAFPLAVLVIVAIIFMLEGRGISIPATRFIAATVALTLMASVVVFLPIVADRSTRSAPHLLGAAGLTSASSLAARNDIVANCIDAMKKNGAKFSAGIAEYWDARGVSYRLQPQIPIVALLNSLEPFYWMSTRGPLVRPSSNPKTLYNFAILEPAASASPFQFTPETVGAILPKPDSKFTCSGGFQIWTWTGNALDRTMKAAVSLWEFKQGWSNSFDVPASMLPATTGTVNNSTRTGIAGSPGFLTFGPYLTLQPGKYKLGIDYSLSGVPAKAPMNTWQVGVFTDPNHPVVLASGTFDASITSVSAPFAVGGSGLSAVEIRTSYGGNGAFTVKSVALEHIAR